MNNKKYAVVDLEATVDEQKSQKHIIQIGMTFIENGQLIDTLTIDIKPPVSIQPNITELTGITNESVQHAPIFEDVAHYLQSILCDNIFVAHNVAFDYVLLQEEFNRAGITDFHVTTVDTLELAQIIYPNEDSYSLSALSTKYNIPLEQHHNAGCDAKATAKLLLQILQDCHKLPPILQTVCYHLLDVKQDKYALFFRGEQLGHIEDWLNEYVVTEQKNSKRNHAKNKMIEQVEANVVLTNVLEQTYNAVAPYIILNGQCDDAIKLKNKNDFISSKQLYYWLRHVNDLTIQEVRQLVKICVWLTQTNDKDIATLSIMPKLKYKLVNTKRNDDYDYYLTQLNGTQNLATTVQTFITAKQNHSFNDKLKNYTLILNDMAVINDYIINETSYMLPLSQYIWKCFAIKQKWREDDFLSDYIFELEKVIKTFFTCIHYLKQYYNSIQQKQMSLKVGEVSEVYLSQFAHFQHDILVMLKNNMTQLIQLLQRIDNEQEDYFNEQLQQIYSMMSVFNTTYYVYVTMKKIDKSMTYTLHIKPLNSQHWLTQLKKDVKQIIIGHNGDINDTIQSYATWLYGKCDKVDAVTVKNKTVLIACAIIENISRVKDNLIVKKLDAFAQKQVNKTVIIVPSKKMIDNIRETQPSALILDNIYEKKVWYKLGEETAIIYMTWQQFVKTTIPSHVDTVILLKLPFDPPGNVYEQAFSQINKCKQYFSTIQLPKVILQLKSIFEKISEQTQIVICDERLIYSSYSEKILTILGENYMIVTQTVENLLKQ